jgi:hypothetical protein
LSGPEVRGSEDSREIAALMTTSLLPERTVRRKAAWVRLRPWPPGTFALAERDAILGEQVEHLTPSRRANRFRTTGTSWTADLKTEFARVVGAWPNRLMGERRHHVRKGSQTSTILRFFGSRTNDGICESPLSEKRSFVRQIPRRWDRSRSGFLARRCSGQWHWPNRYHPSLPSLRHARASVPDRPVGARQTPEHEPGSPPQTVGLRT